jgi:acetoin utilization protein AcuC
VSERVGLVLCPEAKIYDHGPEHPLRPERVSLTWDLIHAIGLDDLPNVERLRSGSPAEDATIELVHTAEFVDATRRAGRGEPGDWRRFGYGPGDNPIFERMHEAGALVVGASIAATQAVWSGDVEHAFNASGGLHHAMPERASGFCVYDDPAVAIAWLLLEGAERIAYVDVDVHHGDGPQFIFYDDPRVLTISVHEYAPWFFPGSGGATERGGPGAEGSAVNLPLPPFTGDDAWLDGFASIVPRLVERFQPDVLVTQLGCDTHATDPLATMRLTTRAYRQVAGTLHALAHAAAEGRWVATGGGGYQWARVVPRAWTLAFAEMAGAEVPDALPEEWVEQAERAVRGEVPATFSEPRLGPGGGDDEAREIAAAVREIAGLGAAG